MRKFVTLFLLLTLSLASVYAPAASYDAHETVTTEQEHFGHHAHTHKDSPSGSEDRRGSFPSQVDTDCPICHGLGMGAIFSICPILSVSTPLSAPPSTDAFYRSAESEYPEHRDKPRIA
jgi:hypothetical protein